MLHRITWPFTLAAEVCQYSMPPIAGAVLSSLGISMMIDSVLGSVYFNFLLFFISVWKI
jgi:hypothetical protein